MPNLDELIAEARKCAPGDDATELAVIVHRLADALEAEARIAELEQGLRIASLGRRVDATLLHEYERRFAEAAKLHRRRDDLEYRWGGGPVCDSCSDGDGWASKWPCPTAVALGLNEGENEK